MFELDDLAAQEEPDDTIEEDGELEQLILDFVDAFWQVPLQDVCTNVQNTTITQKITQMWDIPRDPD